MARSPGPPRLPSDAARLQRGKRAKEAASKACCWAGLRSLAPVM